MKRLLLLTLGVLILSGCNLEYKESTQAKTFLAKDPAAAGAVAAVRDYNRVLTTVYQRNDVTPIKELAVDNELKKLKHMIEGFQAQNLRMDAELKQMRIESVERWGADNVVVKTEENWRYRRVNVQTGEVVKPPTDIIYKMEYKMVYESGRWQLFNLAPL